MIPKVNFKYSYIYDELFRSSKELNKILKKNGKRYPSSVEIIEFMERLEIVWGNEGNKILDEISKLSGIKWKTNSISCYIVGACRPMSEPLTIKVCGDITHAVDVLTHELIHCLQIGISDKKWDKWLKYLDSKYPRENKNTKGHIFLNAVQMALYLDFFGVDRLIRDMWNSNVSVDYKRSWEIVEKEGSDKIVNKFKQITR
ncbi:hypothetical protein FJZ21_02125 [Candidatus Pacearchaeota archaeon]|nr:hypothetical protein [Candidatus Pacearchaeota archaeon]